MKLTFQYRIKDSNHSKRLDRMSKAVNLVWNYCGERTNDSKRLNRLWPSAFDLINLTSGIGQEIGIHSDTVQAVCKQFCISRKKAGKRPRWRTGSGSEKSLGWIPFQSARAITIQHDTFYYLKKKYRIWLSRPIPGSNDLDKSSRVKSGCFSQDSLGRWYINLVCEVTTEELKEFGPEIGIDPNLNNIITCSNGEVFENPRWYRKEEKALSLAQKKGNKNLEKKINRKIRNRRKHLLHVISNRLTKENRLIAVGDVSSTDLARTNMAKSVYDVGWGLLRSMLQYKAVRQGAYYILVDERYSTQTCNLCGLRTGPKGKQGLGMREWICSRIESDDSVSGCKAHHIRDVNAALNILKSGRNIVLSKLAGVN